MRVWQLQVSSGHQKQALRKREPCISKQEVDKADTKGDKCKKGNHA